MKQRPIHIAFVIFFLSFSVLTLEIALTRVFSVILAYHFVFLVVSLALFGLGLGGLLVHYWERKLSSKEKNQKLPEFLVTGYAVVSSLSVIAIIELPILGNLLIYFFITLLPFVFAGAFFAKIFRDWAQFIGKIYFADLLGAALGSLTFLVFINRFGGINTALMASGFAVLAALILIFSSSLRLSTKWIHVAILAVPLLILFFNLFYQQDNRVPISKNSNKDLYRVMQTPGAEINILESRWSPFGRTDLIQDDNDPLSKSIFVDGAAGTPMYKFNGDIKDTTNQALQHLRHYSGFFPLLFLNESQKDNALSIGTGGGRDVLLLLKVGVKNITAVEVNKDAVDIVKDYADFNGGLYDNYPGVTVKSEEGRNFLKHSSDKYDIIFLSIPISKTGNSLNNYALNENTLFTTESILDYDDHLTPEGQLIIVAHNMPEIYKLVFTSINALQKIDLSTPQIMKHILTTGPQMMPVFVLKKQTFTKEESDLIHPIVHAFGFSNETTFIPHIEQVMFRPADNIKGLEEIAMMNNVLVALANGKIELERVLQNTTIDLRPPTDHRPFFYKHDIGLPQSLLLLFWISISTLGLIWLIPMQSIKQELINQFSSQFENNNFPVITFTVLFMLLGAGFMMIELSLFHRFSIYLGHPTITLSILLFSLLLGSGFGSLFSGGFKKLSGKKFIFVSSIIIFVLVIFYLIFLPTLLEKTIQFSLVQRLALAASLILIIGFFMGFPLPSGIRLLKENNLQNLVPWMWALNGATSVLGAVLSIMIAISIGYSWVLILGGLSYFLISIIFLVNSRTF